MTKVALITGGSTPERNVALAGAGLVAEALRQRKYEVHVVDTYRGTLTREEEELYLDPTVGLEPPTPQELKEIAAKELSTDLVDVDAVQSSDVLFLVLHGRQGEGGQLQSLFEIAGLVFVGCDSAGSLLAMDKDVSKRLFEHAGIPTPDWGLWPMSQAALAKIGLPVVVKPSRVGSSVGLTVVRNLEAMPEAVIEAQKFDDCVLVEAFIEGREYTVGVLGDEALAVGEILPSHETFDYQCKYTASLCEEIFPATIDETLADELRRLALAAHRALKLRDFSRADFRVSSDGRVFCLEVNTLPGMAPTSLLPQSAAAAGIPFPELCDRICRMALGRK